MVARDEELSAACEEVNQEVDVREQALAGDKTELDLWARELHTLQETLSTREEELATKEAHLGKYLGDFN